MNQVHHQADGMVWVRSGGKHYGDTLANFALDFGQPLPALPSGVIDRLYDQGVRHPLHGVEGVLDGGPMPWPFGDQAIAAIDTLFAAQKARDDTELARLAAIPKTPQQQIDDLEASMTPRRLREAVLTAEGRAWLANIDARITALRLKGPTQ